jgi:hypothetical protein
VVDDVVVVFGAVVVCVVVCVFVVTGGVRLVVVDFTVVVVVTGATRVTGAVVVTAGVAVVTGAAAVVVDVLGWTAGFLRRAFLWRTARLCGAAAADVVLDVAESLEVVEVLDVVEVVEAVEVVVSPELPHPATPTLAAITASSATFIRPTSAVALGVVAKANNG